MGIEPRFQEKLALCPECYEDNATYSWPVQWESIMVSLTKLFIVTDEPEDHEASLQKWRSWATPILRYVYKHVPKNVIFENEIEIRGETEKVGRENVSHKYQKVQTELVLH